MTEAHAAPRHFLVDSSWTRPSGGSVVLAGSPLRLFRLTPGGRRVAEALEAGGLPPAGHEPLTDRLLDAGAIHPDVHRPSDASSDRPSSDGVSVDVIIPAHDEDPVALADLVASVRRCTRVDRVVIVDDASSTPLAAVPGAEIHRLDVNLGPARARNIGMQATSAPYVVFIDADTSVNDHDDHALHAIDVLARHLDTDDRVALVAPRVRALHGTGTLAAFDAVRSPLDLGDEPARVRASTRVSYVPAAAVMVRRSAFDAIGGFDGVLRFGEDVDLVWRLDEAGWRCRYDPAAVVGHEVRPTLGGWLRQRRDYGTSAAPLARRHGDAVAPVRMSRWSLLAWVAGAVLHPLAGIAVAATTTGIFARRLEGVSGRAEVAVRYAGLGNLHAGRLLAKGLTRTWWPVAVLLALVSRRARRIVLVATVAPAAAEWFTRRPEMDPLRYLALSVADDVAYGTGVWIGCWRERDARALAPDITR